MSLTGIQPCNEGELQILHRFAKSISEGSPIGEVLSDAVDCISVVIVCDTCRIFLREGDHLFLRAAEKMRPEVLEKMNIKINEGARVWAEYGQSPVIIPAMADRDPRLAVLGAFPEDRFEALLSVPILCADRLVGIIAVQNRTEYWYQQDSVAWVKAIGFLMGTEYERSRLEREHSKLEQKMRDRDVFEHAKRLLQEALQISEEDAYLTLQRESKRRRKPMTEIAQAIALTEDLKMAARPRVAQHPRSLASRRP